MGVPRVRGGEIEPLCQTSVQYVHGERMCSEVQVYDLCTEYTGSVGQVYNLYTLCTTNTLVHVYNLCMDCTLVV